MHASDQPLRLVLGEFDPAVEVTHPGDTYPSLIITSSGDYLTGDGTKPPVPAKSRAASRAASSSVTERELADGAVTERTIHPHAITASALAPPVAARLLPPGRDPFDRAEHEGTQSLDTTTDGVARLALSPQERRHLSTVEPGATKNKADDFLLDRANHTGTVSAEDVSGLSDGAFQSVTEDPSLFAPGLPTTGAVRAFVAKAIAAIDNALRPCSVEAEHLAPESVTADSLAPRQIRNEHIAEDAEISLAALVVNPLARGNHTGTQPATTITGLGPLATLLTEDEIRTYLKDLLND